MTNIMECVYCYHAPSLGLCTTATHLHLCATRLTLEKREARVEFSQSYISLANRSVPVPRAAARYSSLYFDGL